jgi:hypothetical protein
VSNADGYFVTVSIIGRSLNCENMVRIVGLFKLIL